MAVTTNASKLSVSSLVGGLAPVGRRLVHWNPGFRPRNDVGIRLTTKTRIRSTGATGSEPQSESVSHVHQIFGGTAAATSFGFVGADTEP